MGLIDEIRNRRDSWMSRFEEQRVFTEPYDHEFEKANTEKIEDQIKRNCKMVGNFPRREKSSR